MDKFIEELKRREKESIIDVMALMSYHISIGRALEKGGVRRFEKMAVREVTKLKKLNTKEDFDSFHKDWMCEFIDKISSKTKGNAEIKFIDS